MEALGTAPARGRAALGALVTVAEEEHEHVYWLAPQGGGVTLEEGKVQVVTPLSPLGRALIAKEEGDVADVLLGGKSRSLEVLAVE